MCEVPLTACGLALQENRKSGLSSRAEEQQTMCVELTNTLKSLRVSHDVRTAELAKLKIELTVSVRPWL